MAKLTVRELRQHLAGKSQDDLISDIVTLFTKLDSVKDYYAMQIGGTHSDDLLNRYKAVIKQVFMPSRGHGSGRLSVARKAVTDYKKASVSPDGLADIMLYYVEMGVQFTLRYGDIDEPFYNSMEGMYEQALKQITAHKLQNFYESRCQKIVRDTNGMGWGFHDGLSDLYDTYFAT
jgi:hypothetical protein